MPAAEIAQRGGAVRVRTQKLPGGKYRKVYVVREAGPRGGHTVAGEVHQKKASGAKVKADRIKADTEPTYRIKPDIGRDRNGRRR
jgi:hypothetical protein